MGIGSIIGGVASAAGGLLSSHNAAHAQKHAANNASAVQRHEFNVTNQQMQPYRQSGYGALNKLNALEGITPTDSHGHPIAGSQPSAATEENALTSTPGYQFQYNQGLRALDHSAAANGTRLSGAADKAAIKYGQGYAQNAYDDQINHLMGLAGHGQNALNTTAQMGANTANSIARNDLAAGNAQSAGIMGGYNALTRGMNNAFTGYEENRALSGHGLYSDPSGSSSGFSSPNTAYNVARTATPFHDNLTFSGT